jgi:asparaginyl-tRNA synthetase
MERIKVKTLLSDISPNTPVLVKGWVKTRRAAKTFSFLEVNDGSCLKNIQVFAECTLP